MDCCHLVTIIWKNRIFCQCWLTEKCLGCWKKANIPSALWKLGSNACARLWLSSELLWKTCKYIWSHRWYSSIRATSRTALFLHWTASVCAARYARSHRLSLELMVAHSKMAYAFTRQLLSSLELRNWLRSSPTNRRKGSHVRLLVLLPSILNYSGTQDSLGLYWQIVQAAKQRI